MLRKVLLACGIISSLLYVAADLLATQQYAGYSYAAQGVSELMAIEAPTRPLIVALFIPYNLLVAAFGVGVWLSAGAKRSLRAAAVLLVVYGLLGFVGLLAAPMHTRGATAAMTQTDTLHIIVTGLLVLLMLLFIGFGAAGLNRGFRIYSLLTVLLMMVGGAVAAMGGVDLAAGRPTPWLGIEERINIYAALLWIAVFAGALWRVYLPAAPQRPLPPPLLQGHA